MQATDETLAPAIHPANACAPLIRHRAAVQLAAALCEKGTVAEADLLTYIGAALPALGKKAAAGIAKEMARQYAN